MFTITIFLGTPFPVEMCASEAWSISSACKNLRAQHPLRAEILCPEICSLGWVNMHLYNFLVCGPKFTRFLLSNVGGDFWRADPFLGYSLSKSKVVRNRAEMWTFFWPSQILRGGPSKNCTHVITPVSQHVGRNDCNFLKSCSKYN